MATALQAERSTTGKTIWMKLILNTWAESMKGLTPCDSGCSYCCHIPTMITEREARELAKATGRIPRARPADVDTQAKLDASMERTMGVPCPFLQDGRCSAYEARPFACRVHYAPTVDNLLCQVVPGEHVTVPQLSVERLTILNYMTYPDIKDTWVADIREWFPSHPTHLERKE